MTKTSDDSTPILVYVHVPFCRSKCHFCDWVTGITPSALRLGPQSDPRRNYIEALVRQIEEMGPALSAQGYSPEILYWGGGTASTLEPGEFQRIMTALHDVFDLSSLAEATMESSPETLDAEKLSLYLETGFTRLSVGVQSMNDQRLRRIGRAHDAAVAADAVKLAKQQGFTDVNVDLISGFPDETLEEFAESLDIVMELPFNHCTLYPYRPAPGTVMLRQMHRNKMGRSWLEEQIAAYEYGRDRLTAAGMPEYALSHFGSPQCVSDLAYFRLDMDWVGFGSGATSLYGGRYRSTARGKLAEFIARPTAFDEDVEAWQPHVTSRLAYQALTTPEGMVRSKWETRLGCSFEEVQEQPSVAEFLHYFERSRILKREPDVVRLVPETISNAFINLLFANSPRGAQRRSAGLAMLGGY